MQITVGIITVSDMLSFLYRLMTGEAPQPNEVLHMWSYPDLNTRAAVRARLQQDPDWRAFAAKGVDVIQEMHSTLLLPTAYSAMR